MIIAVLNSKGGVGKSTIATNLARGLQLSGSSVLLVDTDRQGTTRDWSAMQGEESDYPPVVALDRPALLSRIVDVGRGYDHVVIDGAAKLEEMVAASLKVSDLVLIPVQPSPPDLWSVGELVELIKTRQMVTDGKPRAAFVISRQLIGTNLSQDIEGSLQDFGLDVLTARTTQRVAFAEAFISGSTVLDYEPNGKAAGEIRQLVSLCLNLP